MLLLIDASIPPMAKDKEYADWLIENNVPFTIVFTKCDRNKPGMPSVQENQEELKQQLMVSVCGVCDIAAQFRAPHACSWCGLKNVQLVFSQIAWILNSEPYTLDF